MDFIARSALIHITPTGSCPEKQRTTTNKHQSIEDSVKIGTNAKMVLTGQPKARMAILRTLKNNVLTELTADVPLRATEEIRR
jgi:hypothetical protein